jgi:hypothetical protein
VAFVAVVDQERADVALKKIRVVFAQRRVRREGEQGQKKKGGRQKNFRGAPPKSFFILHS